jgi:hypothetical protein
VLPANDSTGLDDFLSTHPTWSLTSQGPSKIIRIIIMEENTGIQNPAITAFLAP